jgi:Fe2+ or Zn2+ uptake regulation protein
MAHRKTTPPFAGGANTTRDSIIELLSSEWPLSAKTIHHRIKRKTEKTVTYQAVHKMLNNLVEQKVVEKEKGAYKLSSVWVNKIKEHIALIDEKYYGKTKNLQLPTELIEPLVLHFTDWTDACMYVAKLLAKLAEEYPEEPVYALIEHGWWPLRFNFQDYDMIRKLDGHNPGNRVVITSDTPFDKWIGKHYNLICHKDAKLIVGSKEKAEEDILVRKNIIIQIRSSKETKTFLSEIYNNVHGLTDLFKFHFSNKLHEKKADVQITVSENPVLAKAFKEKINQFFEK